MQSGAELWQLDAELLGLSFDGPNGELNVSEKTYGDAVESFLHYIASEPEWEELFDLITASIDDAAKLVDKISHGLYSELGWQVSFQQLETLLQKYYPRDPAYEEALGGNSPQNRDPPYSDEHELIPLHSFEEAGQFTRGPTTERDGQLGVAQTDEDCEQGRPHTPWKWRTRESASPPTFSMSGPDRCSTPAW